jgi:uncharacterized protein YyaL (SSP411 family)
VIIRKKEVYDGAVPSGNAVMADALSRLSILFDQPAWGERSNKMLGAVNQLVIKYPTSFGCWACLLARLSVGIVEIAITGKVFENLHTGLLKEFIPNRVLMATREVSDTFPLLAGKPVRDDGLIYICERFSCLEPVPSVDQAMGLIQRSNRPN